MKKTQVALAALALVASTAALADGVKLYGVADFSMLNDSKGTYAMGAGNNAGSIFGITGSEDLGGGLKAGFTLESGVSFGTGEIVNGGAGGSAYQGIFNRQSNVSVGNETVTVTLGGQISTFVATSLTGLAGVTGNGAFVPALARITGGLGGSATSATNTTGTAGAFFYPDLATVNLNLNGISLTAQTKVGSQTGAGTSVGKYSAYSATTSVGGINLAAAGMSQQSAAGVSGTAYTIGANTVISDVTLRGAYGSGSSTTYDGSGYAIGFDYPLNSALAVGYTYAKSSWTAGDFATLAPGSQNTIGLKYSMSKQTFVYATYSNFSESSILTASQVSGAASKSASFVGLAHSF